MSLDSAAVVATLILLNACIGGLFSYAVKDRAEPWHWPPSWLRVVSGWLGSKGMWLFVLSTYWAIAWIGFTDEAPEWGRWIYVAFLAHFTGWHVASCIYWLTGRSTKRDTPGNRLPIGHEPPEQMRVEDLEAEVAAARLYRTDQEEGNAALPRRTAEATERAATATERIADQTDGQFPLHRPDDPNTK